jgi:type II secretory pathway component PulF
MSQFWYKGRNRIGDVVSGTMEALSPEAVALQLSQTGIAPVTITPVKHRTVKVSLPKRAARVRAEEMIFFTRQLATIVKAGLSLNEALIILGRETENQGFQTALDAIQRDLEGGSSFSDALAKYPRIFPEIYSHSIRAAEEGGFLDTTLTRLATMLDNDLDTRRRVSAAVRYPIFVFVALGIGISIVLTFVIPRFAQLFSAFGGDLPLPTRVMIAVGTFMSFAWPFLLGGVIALGFAVSWAAQRPLGRQMWDRMKLQIPVVSPLVLKLTMARLAHILGTLMGSGIPIISALGISARAVGNSVVARELERVQKAVEGGRALAEPMSQSTIFPPLMTEMVAVGEKTGALETLLHAVAEHYENEANHTIKNLPTIIEPILLIVVATFVLFLALAVFMPLWDMVGLIRK